jgi:hypothetical protein
MKKPQNIPEEACFHSPLFARTRPGSPADLPSTRGCTGEDVEAGDTSSTIEFLKTLIVSPVAARTHFQNIDISFDGFNDDSREVFQIGPIRVFVTELNKKFPYWLYFMNPACPGLYAIAMCLLPLGLEGDTKDKIHLRLLTDYMSKQWVPALCHIGEWTGLSEVQVELLSRRSVDYFLKGPQKPPIVS